MKMKLLVLAGYYLPGVKGGGPIQSTKNLVDVLKEEYDIFILANDRDLGDDNPYSNVELNKWILIDGVNIYYTNLNTLNYKKIVKILKSRNFQILYLNSVFSFKLSVLPMLLTKLKILEFKKVILSPRGNFSEGALSLKVWKKKIFIWISRNFNLYKSVTWHATAQSEKKDIEKYYGINNDISIIKNLTADYEKISYDKFIEKVKGKIKIVFLSRIHPKKNLKMALELLKTVEGLVEFNIYGPIEDERYWRECQQLIKFLPTNITVRYKGLVNHKDVSDVFKRNHIFLFPTLGENFGHVISEAFIGGCPVIISDRTPWRNLTDFNVGWDIDLKDECKFRNVIQFYINTSNEEYKKLSMSAYEYGKRSANKDKEIEKYINLFNVIE